MTMAFNFDAPAMAASFIPDIWSPAQRAWADTQLEEALCSNKTRLKLIRGDEASLRDVQAAILLIAKAKALSYTAAVAGTGPRPTDTLFDWVGKRPDMAEASVVLAHALVAETDISAIPQELIHLSRAR